MNVYLFNEIGNAVWENSGPDTVKNGKIHIALLDYDKKNIEAIVYINGKAYDSHGAIFGIPVEQIKTGKNKCIINYQNKIYDAGYISRDSNILRFYNSNPDKYLIKALSVTEKNLKIVKELEKRVVQLEKMSNGVDILSLQ